MAVPPPAASLAMARFSQLPKGRIGSLFATGVLTSALWTGSGAAPHPSAQAQNCEPPPTAEHSTLAPDTATETAQSSQPYASPVDLSNITPAQQRQLQATVAERQQRLPYQFLSLYRCPSLSNSAINAFEAKDYALALSLLERAIAQRPNSLTRWLDRAIVHYYLGEDAAARSDANQVHRRLVDLNFPDAQDAYDQLITQLDGNASDARRAQKR